MYLLGKTESMPASISIKWYRRTLHCYLLFTFLDSQGLCWRRLQGRPICLSHFHYYCYCKTNLRFGLLVDLLLAGRCQRNPPLPWAVCFSEFTFSITISRFISNLNESDFSVQLCILIRSVSKCFESIQTHFVWLGFVYTIIPIAPQTLVSPDPDTSQLYSHYAALSWSPEKQPQPESSSAESAWHSTLHCAGNAYLFLS